MEAPPRPLPPPLVQLSGIVKRFPGRILANDCISLEIAAGEIHALLGENGAGKSTLMQILYGVYQKDAGEIRIDGRLQEFATPGDAIRHGVGMIHQEFMLVRSFSVAENVAMGTAGAGGEIDLPGVGRRVRDLADKFGLDVDPRSRVEHLPLGVQQRVEILKLLYRDARVLILDEPTSVLTPQEVARLFDVLRALKAAGKSIVIVTHKLREVVDIADRVTVLRDGRVVATLPVAEATELSLARLMVGRDVILHAEKKRQPSGPAVLRVENLSAVDAGGQLRVKNISFSVHAGEILGLAGVDGNGQSELIECLFGLRSPAGGRVWFKDRDITFLTPAQRRKEHIAYLPADRRHVGSIAEMSLADNVVLGAQRQFARWGGAWRDRKGASAHARRLMSRFGVRAPGPDFPVGKLSGGNLQKVVLGRELMRDPWLLLVEQPTRGLDVGAIETVWAELLAQRAERRGILLVSAELDEILNLADRIAVMFDGEIIGIVPAAEAKVEMLGLMMAGRRALDPDGPTPREAAVGPAH
jgi:general nucleoside transport system ATP-binding protein